ncbi:MAG: hypothetical protein WC728_14800 [Elusimicrobiota bacterium]
MPDKKRGSDEEKAICRAFVHAYDKRFGNPVKKVRRGKPPEPDFVCDNGLGIEVTTVYESQEMARWQNAPGQPAISPLTANPIRSMQSELLRLIEQKSGKTYEGCSQLLLVLWAKAMFSSHEVLEQVQKSLRLKSAGPFKSVWAGCSKDNGYVFFSLWGLRPTRIEYP